MRRSGLRAAGSPVPPTEAWTLGCRYGLPLLAVLVVPVAALVGTNQIDQVLGDLPWATYNLAASFTRMLLAYALSLAFSLGYGYLAAVNRVAERVMIPILDILQSVPILGFLPVVIYAITSVPGLPPLVGLNIASIFLIFTSMSWNMAFGVYESTKALPHDLKEAGESFGVRGAQRARRVTLPAMVNRLVYNSVLSWTGGWYFLVAAEFIATSANHTVTLVGIGSLLLDAVGAGDTDMVIAGILVLVVLIILLDVLVWRNLGHWAERYRMDTSPSGEAIEARTGGAATASLRRVRNVVGRGLASGKAIVLAPIQVLGSVSGLRPATRPPEGRRRKVPWWGGPAVRYGVLGTVLVVCWLMLITLGVGVFNVLHAPVNATVHAQILSLPLALAYSMGRVMAAYLISLGAALGLALLLIRRPRAARVGLPVVQIVASVPATALFPLFLFGLVGVIGIEPAVIFVEVTGMIWYLFFNLLSGLRSIPPDMVEAARSYGIKGRNYYRRLVFPAIFSSFITGSITAFGGGWNTLIIAEYLMAGKHTVQVLGLGELIDLGALPVGSGGEAGGAPIMVAALVTMVIAVVAVNQLLWKPLYRRASERYRYD